MTASQARVSTGVPSGGQFVSRARAESSVRLHVPVPSNEAFGDQASVPDAAYFATLDEMNAQDPIPA